MLLGLYSYFRFCFRHIQTYLSTIQEHTHAYSEPCVFLAYSEPWHIPVTKHIQISRYIDNTILNIFSKATSWKFDTVLNAPVSYPYSSRREGEGLNFTSLRKIRNNTENSQAEGVAESFSESNLVLKNF